MRIPCRLAVIVCVDVDKARRDQATFGVDLLAALARDIPDRGYTPPRNGNIVLGRSAALPVGDRAASYDQIVSGIHGVFSSNSCPETVRAGRVLVKGNPCRPASGMILLGWNKPADIDRFKGGVRTR